MRNCRLIKINWEIVWLGNCRLRICLVGKMSGWEFVGWEFVVWYWEYVVWEKIVLGICRWESVGWERLALRNCRLRNCRRSGKSSNCCVPKGLNCFMCDLISINLFYISSHWSFPTRREYFRFRLTFSV